MPSKPLTENQTYVLATLRERGAHFTAAATESAWLAGRAYQLDMRFAFLLTSDDPDLVPEFTRGNKEATGGKT